MNDIDDSPRKKKRDSERKKKKRNSSKDRKASVSAPTDNEAADKAVAELEMVSA